MEESKTTPDANNEQPKETAPTVDNSEQGSKTESEGAAATKQESLRQSENRQQIINTGDITKNSVDLIKNFDFLKKMGGHISVNIEVNNIAGNSYTDSTHNDGGKGNTFQDEVRFGETIENENVKPAQYNSESATINLLNYADVQEYLEEQQHNPYCSFIIALSIFGNSQFNLVSEEAQQLYHIIADESRETKNDKGDVVIIKREPFELSRKKATAYFGIEFYEGTLITFGGRIATPFVGFSHEEHSLNILRCIFSEFTALKHKITAYLTMLICSEKVTLYVAAINTLINLCDLDPEYFISKIVARLLQNKSIPSDIAVAQVLCAIATHSKNEYSADRYLNIISNIDKDVHYYIITLMMSKTLEYDRKKIRKAHSTDFVGVD